jgi:hypothetical protein
MTQVYLHELLEPTDHYHVHTDVQQWAAAVTLNLATPQIHTFLMMETDILKAVYAHVGIPTVTKNTSTDEKL